MMITIMNDESIKALDNFNTTWILRSTRNYIRIVLNKGRHLFAVMVKIFIGDDKEASMFHNALYTLTYYAK
jgi:hypothetical protein